MSEIEFKYPPEAFQCELSGNIFSHFIFQNTAGEEK